MVELDQLDVVGYVTHDPSGGPKIEATANQNSCDAVRSHMARSQLVILLKLIELDALSIDGNDMREVSVAEVGG